MFPHSIEYILQRKEQQHSQGVQTLRRRHHKDLRKDVQRLSNLPISLSKKSSKKSRRFDLKKKMGIGNHKPNEPC